MTLQIRCILIVTSIITMLYLMKKIRNFKLQIEYSIFWVIFAAILILLAIFPQVAYFAAHLLGFQSPSNLIFLLIIFILMLKSFMMTIELDTLDKKLKELIQTIALDNNEKNNKDC